METQATAAPQAPQKRRRFKQAAGYLLTGTAAHAAADRQRMERYCAEHNLKLAEVYEDQQERFRDVNFDERPGGRQLFADMKGRRLRHIVMIDLHVFAGVQDLTFQMARLQKRSRQVHLLRWKPAFVPGLGLYEFEAFSTEGDPAGIFWWTVKAISHCGNWNATEATLIAGRKYAGRVVSGTPYGFDRIGASLYHNDAEQAVIERVTLMRKSGATWRDIADTLNQDGLPAKNGGKWFAASVRHIGSPYHTLAQMKHRAKPGEPLIRRRPDFSRRG